MEPGQLSRTLPTRPPGPEAANGTIARPDYRPTRAVSAAAAPHGLLDLQATAGNRAVAGLVARMVAIQRDPPDPAPATTTADELVAAAVAMAGSGTLLLADDIRTALEARASDTELAAAFDTALGQIEWGAPESGPIGPLTQAAGDMVRLLERRFILDPKRSTLDLLGPRRSARYRKFAWEPGDFPGGKVIGANESRAKEMIGAMGRIRPERRANSTADAVIVESESNRTLEREIRAQQIPVEGQGRRRLHPDAAASFVRMHAAAEAEGVDLHILNSDRSFKASRAGAARLDHPEAKAAFSSHNLGLAVDLKMSTRRKRFREMRTSPFGKLVEMHAAPAHKWMFLRGEAFGWFPFSNEPWHWEFNPSGFRATYREGLGLPPDDPAPEAETAPAEDG